MYSKVAPVALLLASAGAGATYTEGFVAVPTGTGVASPPYPTGGPSNPGNQPRPEEPLQVTVDNCITFRNAGIALTCSDTPDSLRPGNATANGYMMRRKRTTYGLGHGPVVPSPPLGGKRPLCYKFILGYNDENGPVAPQQFPCYADDSQNPSHPQPGIPLPPAGTGTVPIPTPQIPENSDTPPESIGAPPNPTPTGPSENAEIPPEKPEVPETLQSPPETPAAPAPPGPTGGYQAATPPQPSAQAQEYTHNLRY